MKEIKLYPSVSYATKVISDSTISLEEAIKNSKTFGDHIVLVLKSRSNNILFIQIVNIFEDGTVNVIEQRVGNNHILKTWKNVSNNTFFREILHDYPHTEGYSVQNISELIKIVSVNIPEWLP